MFLISSGFTSCGSLTSITKSASLPVVTITAEQQQHETLCGRNAVQEGTVGERLSDRPIHRQPNTRHDAREKMCHPDSGRP